MEPKKAMKKFGFTTVIALRIAIIALNAYALGIEIRALHKAS